MTKARKKKPEMITVGELSRHERREFKRSDAAERRSIERHDKLMHLMTDLLKQVQHALATAERAIQQRHGVEESLTSLKKDVSDHHGRLEVIEAWKESMEERCRRTHGG